MTEKDIKIITESIILGIAPVIKEYVELIIDQKIKNNSYIPEANIALTEDIKNTFRNEIMGEMKNNSIETSKNILGDDFIDTEDVSNPYNNINPMKQVLDVAENVIQENKNIQKNFPMSDFIKQDFSKFL